MAEAKGRARPEDVRTAVMAVEGLERSLWHCEVPGCDYTHRLWKPPQSLYRPACPDHPEVLLSPWDGTPKPRSATVPPTAYPEPL